MFAMSRKVDKSAVSDKGADPTEKENDRPDIESGETFKRRKKLSLSRATTVEICGIDVHFPFQPYSCQLDYMQKVIEALHRKENALLESPTGTGKTLCLLCSTLAWQRQQAKLLYSRSSTDVPPTDLADSTNIPNNNGPQYKVPTIIYASRTHSQLTQVINELKNTRYRPRHAVLGSREQLCIHPKVKTTEASAADINLGCQKLCKDRKCKYRNNLEGFVTPSNVDQQPVLDIEELYELGKKKDVCPFYLTRNNVADAEIIFLPYNYLFDLEARTQSLAEVRFENSILIFDESHNLESFASDSASFDLSGLDIGGCVHEVSRAIGYFQSGPETLGLGSDGFGSDMKLENLVRLKGIFLQFENYLENQIPPTAGSFAGEYIFEIFAQGAKVNFQNRTIFLDFVRQVSVVIMEVRGAGVSSTGTPKLDHFSTCVKRIFGNGTMTEGQSIARARSYRVHITAKVAGSIRKDPHSGASAKVGIHTSNSANSSRVLSYWCFAPALAMNELMDLKVRSIIVTSGTLSPLSSYSLELGISFQNTLENPHIISNRQICVKVIGKGVSGKILSSNYERREDIEYITELGNTIISLVRVIPAGVLIFFPSYGVLENCAEKWGGPVSSRTIQTNNSNKPSKFFESRKGRDRHSIGTVQSAKVLYQHRPSTYDDQSSTTHASPWRRMLAIKSIVIEPKQSSDLTEAIEQYERQIFMPNSPGCLFLGVCRGKISEGIDFADDRCRAVIITGLPFPPYNDPKVKLKREFLDGIRAEMMKNKSNGSGFKTDPDSRENAQSCNTPSLTGADYYTNQAFRAVNQAVGRVIRHKADYGAVLLLDNRFEQAKYQIGLSKWLRPHIDVSLGIGASIVSLKRFFIDAAPAQISRSHLNDESNQVDDCEGGIAVEELNDVRKMVVVRPDPTNHNYSNSNSSDSMRQVQSLTQEESNFIHPDRIIKTVDLNGSMNDKDSCTVNLPQLPRKPSAPSEGLESLYKRNSIPVPKEKPLTSLSSTIASAWSAIDRNNAVKTADPVKVNQLTTKSIPLGSSSCMGGKTSTKVSPKDDQNGIDRALEFFNAAKRILRSNDFALLGTKLKTLHLHGKSEDSEVYLRISSEIIDLLLLIEQDESVKLLDLFYQLLPPKYMSNVVTIACTKRFDASKFKELCQQHLPTADFDYLWKNISKAMITYSVDVVALGHIKPMIDIWNGKTSISKELKSSLFESMLRILPRKVRDPVTAMWSHMNDDSLEKWLDKCKQPPTDLSNTDKCVPKGMNCIVCKNPISQPYLAECGHSACSQCWTSWLAKSQSCPFCRKPTTKDSLAKIVFADEKTSSVPKDKS